MLMHPALDGQPHEPARPLNRPPAPLPFSAVQPAGDSLIDATSTNCQPPTFCPLSPDVQYNPGDFLIDVTSMDYRSPELEASTRQRCGGGRLAACRGRRVGGVCMGVLAGPHKCSVCGLVGRKQAALAWPVLARTQSPRCSVSIARLSSVELLGQLYEGRRGEMSGTVTVDEASGGGSTLLRCSIC